MATEFKVVVKASALTTAIPNTSNTNSNIYVTGVNTDTVVIGLLLANKLGASIVADVAIVQNTDGSGAGEDVYLIKGAQIPVGSSLEVISGKVVLANRDGSNDERGDALQVRCDTANALDVTLSILENTP